MRAVGHYSHQKEERMKLRYIVGSLFAIAILSSTARTQVTGLLVNGVPTNFTMTTGDTIGWTFNCPVGSTTVFDLWFDVNANGTIDPGVDQLVQTFSQTDGDTAGNGPPDLDGSANGHVIFAQPVGLAPGHFVMKLTNNGLSVICAGTINPLSSPAFSVSGHITPPSGKSAQYVLVEIDRHHFNPNFWQALTDASGNYTIYLTADTAGNPWNLRVATQFAPSILTPTDTNIVINQNLSGLNFTFISAAAQVAGTLKDELGNPISDVDVELNGNTDFSMYTSRTNVAGFFQVGLPSGELNGQTWTVSSTSPQQFTTTALLARFSLPVINYGDSLYRNLVVYNVNSFIKGYVQVTGFPFPGRIGVSAQTDSATAYVLSDSATGSFTVGVSNKLSHYLMGIGNYLLPPGGFIPIVYANPGDTGVVINITDGVVDRLPGIPKQFGLGQNYPNPFNPSTQITYDLPKAEYVHLTVFSLLGQEVSRLVDRQQDPGNYRVTFNPLNLPAGVYFYELKAGSYTSVRKMLLIK